eukprot:CAMPEP_0174230116 /NCGR_PEP_ID=MMETSP0417-20130205/933_1 /TAXON_ID=242541 /ORGANISM="Mayorella sp, Strain BSH-02190019" /LENGTH=431 /DNA_ID=CAMNT_0015307747 /DNA_START=1 /DNA_END=1297 /DNA_ORIENTATION=-
MSSHHKPTAKRALSSLEKELAAAIELAGTDLEAAGKAYDALIDAPTEASISEVDKKAKETAVYRRGEMYGKAGDGEGLRELLRRIRPFFDRIPKARTAKIVRTLIEIVASIEDSLALQIELCVESIVWARAAKRTFLRQRIEARLADLYLQQKDYQSSLTLLTALLKEVKRLDDKALLVEIHLLESKVQHRLRNLPKARTALTAARTAVNSIYCPPLLQGEIDMQAGVLHAESRDYKTSYSYFFEAFENYDSMENSLALRALKYMFLCKIMMGRPSDVNQLMAGKLALKYAGREVESMAAIADAHKKRSLEAFEAALRTFHVELGEDPVIHSHLKSLYDEMLEQNLCRLIEPFSVVEIEHIAALIKLDVTVVEKKLSQMILDQKFQGVLDQGTGQLIIFDEETEDQTYPAALETIQNMSKVVDSLINEHSI